MCAMMQKLRTLLATSTRCGRSDFNAMRRAPLQEWYAAVEDQRCERGANEQLQHEEDDQEGEIESAERWDDAAYRHEHRLDERREHADPAAAAQVRNPRDHGVGEHQHRVDVDGVVQQPREVAGEEAHVPFRARSMASSSSADACTVGLNPLTGFPNVRVSVRE